MSSPVAVYVHTPFCPSKCGYCDFNSYAMSGEVIERTTQATIQEILSSPWRGRPAKTIFFGGGTPTYLSERQLCSILEAVIQVHPPIEGCEITSEANPGTVDMPKFRAMLEAGFNRISLGAQSFNTSDLIQLGRIHEPSHVGRAVETARNAGFDNVNIDLMFALPGQSLRAWKNNLELAVSLGTDHLSLYCLTIEQNTRFYKLWLKGMLDLPDDAQQTAMYDEAISVCEGAGLAQYEISNFAKPGRECEHNLCYWRSEEYASYGPGAVGCMESPEGRVRYTNTKHPDHFSTQIEKQENHWCDSEVLGQSELNTERIMMGIRLNSGLDLASVNIPSASLDKVISLGWAEVKDNILRLTPAGRHFCSEVTVHLI